jgi:3-oxoadipate enol-lactonase
VLPGVASLTEVEAAASHKPFQEVPDDWNARVNAFWREVDAGA